MADPKDKIKKVAGIRVTAAKAGFRRAGRSWSGVTEVAVNEFSKEQLAQIRAEPLLVVEDIDMDAPGQDA